MNHRTGQSFHWQDGLCWETRWEPRGRTKAEEPGYSDLREWGLTSAPAWCVGGSGEGRRVSLLHKRPRGNRKDELGLPAPELGRGQGEWQAGRLPGSITAEL